MNPYSEIKFERNRWREVLPIKYTPSKFPVNLYQQSGQWIKCCSDCTPNSNVLYESKEKNYYFVNLLDTKAFRFDPITYYVKENWIKCSNSTAIDSGSLAVVERSILSNQNLREFVDYNVREASGANKAKLAKIITDKIRHHLAAILGRLSSCHSDYTLKLSLFVLRTVLKLCFSQILCYSVHLSGLRKAQTKQLPLVYVLDCEEPWLSSAILQLTLVSNGFKPASLFLPKTQSVSLLDTLIQRALDYLGFRRVDQRMLIVSMLLDQIRQRDATSSLFEQELEGESSTDDAVLYRQALLAYLQETMRNEKAVCMTVQDFSLDLITKLIETETVHDALVVPVSISYELTASYSYLSNELRVNDSPPALTSETASGARLQQFARIVQRSANLVRFFSSRFCRWLLFRSDAYTSGQVRVNFGQAYSLKEFIETKTSKMNYSMTAVLTHKTQPPRGLVVDYTRRAIESELRMHLKYDINQSGSVMCTNITAFVLLNNYPTGCCTSKTLTQRFTKIRNALAVNHQIGFLVKTDQDAVNYSLHLLKPYLTIEQQQQEANNETRSCLLIKPRDANSACILFKHGRVVGRAFFLQSVLACAINSKLNGTGGSLSHHMMMRSSPIVYEHDLMKRCFEIIRLFQYEFDTYKKPCEPINTRLVNIMSSHEMLAPSSRSMQRSKYSSNFGFDEHSDDEDIHQSGGGSSSSSSSRLASLPATTEPFDLGRIYTENLVDNREIDEWAALDPTYKSYLLKLSATALTDLKYFVKILQPYVHIYQRMTKTLKDLEVGRLYADNELLDLIQSHPSQSKSDPPKLDIGDCQLQVESLDYFVRCRLISKLDSARCSAINAATNKPRVIQSAYTYRLDQEQRARLDQLDIMLSSIF